MFAKTIFPAILMSIVCLAEASYFTPFIVESSNDEVCNTVLEHYVQRFEGKTNNTSGPIQSPRVHNPDFVEQELDGPFGSLKYSKVSMGGVEKIFAYHRYRFNWRGEVYTGYLIDPDELDTLVSTLTTPGKDTDIWSFHPSHQPYRRASFTWHENLPFKVADRWYVRHDSGTFSPMNNTIYIERIELDSTVERVCKIRTFGTGDPSRPEKKLPFFSAYQRSVEEIMVSFGHGGSSHPEVWALNFGRKYAVEAVTRPWAIKPYWEDKNEGLYGNIVQNQKSHFNNWKYKDVWSWREHEALDNAKQNAHIELKKRYRNIYFYSEEEAERLADKVIDEMVGSYYSLASFPNKNKDFTAFQEMLEGKYKEWVDIESDLRMRYEPLSLAPLSLLVDIPGQLEKLPNSVVKHEIKTDYGKNVLMFSAHMNNYDSVKYLLDAGWPINEVTTPKDSYEFPQLSRTNRSALTYAAENGSLELINLLIARGADKKIKDSRGNTLDYYIQKNPRFSLEEKALGLDGLLERYDSTKQVKPSFDCSSSQLNQVERAICTSTGLTIYDRELSGLYRKIRQQPDVADQIKQSQIEWIKYRRKICNEFEVQDQLNGCIARTTRARIRYLRYVLDAVNFKDGDKPLPVKPRR